MHDVGFVSSAVNESVILASRSRPNIVLTAIISIVAWLKRPASSWTAAAICVLGLGLRVFVAAYSKGTNDIDTWFRFANMVTQFGVLKVYELDHWFNHPPLMGLYGAAALKLTTALQADFSFVFKVVPMIASAATTLLVHRLVKLPPVWLLLYAINPTDVLVSAYHGNTDLICVMLCVVSVLFANSARPWASGFALGAALNVKLIPVILIAPLALSLRLKQMPRFFIALGLCALPFVPVVLGPWEAFKQNAILYNSFPAPWGLGLISAAMDGRLLPLSTQFAVFSLAVGKPFIIGSSLMLGLIQFWYRPWTRADVCAIAFSCFLVFSPGFGAQYLVYPIAFLAAAPGTRRGFRYMYLSGAFVFFIYYGYWTGTIPAFSHFDHGYDLRTILFGFLAWLALGQHLVSAVQRGIRRVIRVEAERRLRPSRSSSI